VLNEPAYAQYSTGSPTGDHRAALEIDEERVPDSLQQRALCLGVLDLVALPHGLLAENLHCAHCLPACRLR